MHIVKIFVVEQLNKNNFRYKLEEEKLNFTRRVAT